MDWSRIKKIYFIGIKGVGMTMLAQFLAQKKYSVSGSDNAEKYLTDEVLEKEKIKVIENFSAGNLPPDADLIVYSTAYNKENNPELAKAFESGKKILTYAEALSEVFNAHYGIAVVGSHGKTTTTAMLGFILMKAGLKPSVLVGSRVPQLGGSGIVGASDIMAAEVDEYQNKLKYFNPKGALLNNIDYDHPDFFPTEESYEKVFIDFIKKIPKKGFLIANFDDSAIRRTARVNCKGKVISYSLEDKNADYSAYDLESVNGTEFFKVKMGEDELGEFSLRLAGRHNVYNSLAVIAAAIELEADLSSIREALAEFSGAARRIEELGEFRGAKVIDDYAHHPTEIKATLAALREKYPKDKIRIFFHPHTFTRTKALLDDFASSFEPADEVVVLDIYGSAREKQGGVSSLDLTAKIKKHNLEIQKKQEVRNIPTIGECAGYLKKTAEKGEVIALMGAGDVFRVFELLK